MYTGFELEQFALEIGKKLERGGFHLVRHIKEADAWYYALGERKDVIRIGCTKYSKFDKVYDHPVSCCVTFKPDSNYTVGKMTTMIEMAVGRYILSAGNGNAKFRHNKIFVEEILNGNPTYNLQ